MFPMSQNEPSTPPLPERHKHIKQPPRAKSTSSMSWSPRSIFPPTPRGWGFNQPRKQKAPAKPPDYEPRPPEDFPVKLSLKLEPEEKDTYLARICSDALTELPLMVQVKEEFAVEGNDVNFEKGEMLMLHFIAELPRVHAVDTSDGTEKWLPVYAKQEYERLPLGKLYHIEQNVLCEINLFNLT